MAHCYVQEWRDVTDEFGAITGRVRNGEHRRPWPEVERGKRPARTLGTTVPHEVRDGMVVFEWHGTEQAAPRKKGRRTLVRLSESHTKRRDGRADRVQLRVSVRCSCSKRSRITLREWRDERGAQDCGCASKERKRAGTLGMRREEPALRGRG